MTVIDVDKNLEARTLTLSARFEAPPQQVWQVWEDPRLLERWWGPPTYPATVVEHKLAPGGLVTYFMTSPEGEKYHGRWNIVSVDAPRSLEFEDAFADESGDVNPDLPVSLCRVTVEPDGEAATLMRVVTSFPTVEAMEQVLAMGAAEGMTAAMGQIDALVASPVA